MASAQASRSGLSQPHPGPAIDTSKWEDEMSKADISKADMNALVFDYLVVEGFSDAAVEFARETGLPHDVDHAMIQERMEIREAVEDGRVEEAVRRVNELDPEILDTNSMLLFHLHLLRFIELIREEKVDEALEFATTELAPRGAENPEYLADLERAMALLAFPDLARFADDAPTHSTLARRPPPEAETLDLLKDPAFEPMNALMKKSQRVKVAKELNSAILQSHGQGMEPKLGGLVRLLSWGQQRLKDVGIGVPWEEEDKGHMWADSVLSVDD